MHALVTCSTCHRVERWSRDEGPWTVAVELPGAGRRPAVHPQLARGRTALAAAAGGPRVVGVCEACGQLLVTRDAGPDAIDVHVDTPGGRVTVAGGQITGPTGSLTGADADAFLAAQYPEPRVSLATNARDAVMFVWLIPLFVFWLMAVGFVVTFFANLYTGAPPVVSGVPGFTDPRGAPAPKPAP